VAHPSDHRLLVLQGIRLKGNATAATIASLYGLAPDVVEKELAEADEAGLVRHREGVLSGWALLPEGRVVAAALVADELARAGAEPVVESAYRGFLDLNHAMLGACTAWQLRDGGLNDHTDARYDASVVADLASLHERSVPVTDALGAALDRFAAYGPRLSGALAKVQAGQGEWFTKPVIDSYHTVWFELHEDLLATLGRERASEGAG
jgi:hypothetical protein